MAEKLILKSGTWQAMRRHVRHKSPLEACGLLAGKDNRVELSIGIPNMEPSPVRFRMNPRAQWRAFQRIEAAGIELLGIYHSHPQGPDHPSQSDIEQAMYPLAQIIWFFMDGRWQGRGFRIEGGNLTEISLEFSEPE
jgi:proteasome lid subunit RPN8/RPN11